MNDTLENQLENNQANDASLEMYHTAMEQVFRKYNIPYKNNVVSTEDYSATTVSMEKQKGFLSNLKDGVWNIIIKVYNAIKEFFKKIFNMVFRRGKAKAQELHKDVTRNEKTYDIAYKIISENSTKSSMEDGNGFTIDVDGHVTVDRILIPSKSKKKFGGTEDWIDVMSASTEWDMILKPSVYKRQAAELEDKLEQLMFSEKDLNENLDAVERDLANPNLTTDARIDLYESLRRNCLNYARKGKNISELLKEMTNDFIHAGIPGLEITTSEDYRLNVREFEENREVLLATPELIRVISYSVYETLDEMNKINKLIESYNIGSMIQSRRDFEQRLPTYEVDISLNGAKPFRDSFISEFKKRNTMLTTFFINLSIIIKYVTRYVQALISYFDKSREIYKQVLPYLKEAAPGYYYT